MRYTPEIVTDLQENEIFVFGSTLGGQHRGGAAKMAVDRFGAVMGQGQGLQGRSYAIPVMLKNLDRIKIYVADFIAYAKEHHENVFLVTKVGCGKAGYSEETMASMFAGAAELDNICLPESFCRILGITPQEPILVVTDVPTSTTDIAVSKVEAPKHVVTTDASEITHTVSPKVEVKVVGKIDLSKLPMRRKTSCYIIDTNVFIDCPDIISKISKNDKIVLSAKVVDELDSLKVRLDGEGKRNVQIALRNINGAIQPRKIEMKCADLSVLPADFGISPDNMILSVAYQLRDQNAVMLTSDNGLQIKCKGLGIRTVALRNFL